LRTPLTLLRTYCDLWWQVQDSNLCSFRDGFTVREAGCLTVSLHTQDDPDLR
jgi:hypothetical protein